MDNHIRLTLAAHVLKHLAAAQIRGRVTNLDDLADKLPEHARTRIRSTLSSLHEQGLLDVTTMRLSLQGFALGQSFLQRKLAAIPAPARPRLYAVA